MVLPPDLLFLCLSEKSGGVWWRAAEGRTEERVRRHQQSFWKLKANVAGFLGRAAGAWPPVRFEEVKRRQPGAPTARWVPIKMTVKREQQLWGETGVTRRVMGLRRSYFTLQYFTQTAAALRPRTQVYRRYRWDPARRACTGIGQSAGHRGPHGNTGTAGSSRGQSGPQNTLEVKTERK